MADLTSSADKHRFVMIAPYNAPQVQAPLGWALAESTRASMEVDVTDAIQENCSIALFRGLVPCKPGAPPP